MMVVDSTKLLCLKRFMNNQKNCLFLVHAGNTTFTFLSKPINAYESLRMNPSKVCFFIDIVKFRLLTPDME